MLYVRSSFLVQWVSKVLLQLQRKRVISLKHIIPGPKIIELFSCSTQLSKKFILLINIEIHQLLAFLAHLSRRLIGELIGYSWSGVRQSIVRPLSIRSKCSKMFFSKTARPIKAKFYVEPPWVGGTKVCSWHLGHMTRWPPYPYMVKTLQKSSSPEPAGQFSQNFLCSIGDSSPS